MKKSTLIIVCISFFSTVAFAGNPFSGKGDFVSFELDSMRYTINKTEVVYILTDDGDDMQVYFKGSPTLNPLVLDFDDKPVFKTQVYEAIAGKKLEDIKQKKKKSKKSKKSKKK